MCYILFLYEHNITKVYIQLAVIIYMHDTYRDTFSVTAINEPSMTTLLYKCDQPKVIVVGIYINPVIAMHFYTFYIARACSHK